MAYNLFKNWYYLATNLTDPEKALEHAIAGLGQRYRSQWLWAGLRHISDFVLLDSRVVIEVDGKSHDSLGQRVKDLVHTLALERMGWKVVRCTNEEATRHPHVVVSELLGDRLSHRPSLSELEAKLEKLKVECPELFIKKPKRVRSVKSTSRSKTTTKVKKKA